MPDRLHVQIEGRVQGVGFRFATYDQAVGLGLKGWVRNLPDGRVEAEFEGRRELLDYMLDWCREGPRMGRVTHVDASWEQGGEQYRAFEIRGF